MPELTMHRFVRLSQIAFVLAGTILLAGPDHWFPDYYRPLPMGGISFLFALAVELPAWLFRPSPRRVEFQVALALGLALSGLGSLGLWGLYRQGIPYDKFVHLLFPALMGFAGPGLLVAGGWSMKKAALAAALSIGSVSVLWEVIEHVASVYFHLGFFGTLWDRDSLLDIVANLAGLAAGLWVFLKKERERARHHRRP